ncbi:MAG: diguanylate cyclase [Solirubrobacteraceae bacterium]|nr:diguanylate cyclase [Solirubrobacteraceae bacterium]
MTLLVALGYLALAVGVFATIDPNATRPCWPGAGLAVAALCLSRPRQWPALLAGVFVAGVAAGLSAGVPMGACVGWAISGVVGPLLVVIALRRVTGHAVLQLDSVRRVFVFGAVVVFSGPPVASLLSAMSSLVWLGQPLWPTWPRWMIGDALGILLVAPVIFHASRVRAFGRRPHGAALLTGAAIIPILAFLPTGDAVGNMPYFVTPVLLTAALSGGVAGAAAASLVMAIALNALGTAGYRGSFGGPAGDTDSLLLMQVFVAVQSLTAMLIAGQATALRHAGRHIAHQEDSLHHDTLTGVGNRRALDRALAAARDERRATAGIAVLFLDLDDFKQINDRFGHEAGDAMLRDIADRCAQLVRAGDTVARTGGDEFAVVCPDISQDSAAELRDRLQIELGTVSVGMAWAPSAATNVAALVSRADADMYAVKASRRRELTQMYGAPVSPRA